MSSQSVLQEARAISSGPLPRLLLMFFVAAAPLGLFVIGGYDLKTLGLPGALWYFTVISLFLLACTGIGYVIFRHKTTTLSIGAKPFESIPQAR